MNTFYSTERNVQMLVYLMKHHGIKRIVASPGTTNLCLVASLQCDSYFQIYSSVDERSAAYIACGLAAETGEPVALSCTGATASRNYLPGLTEAFYRKLPVLAITSRQHIGRIGNYWPQVIDRSVQPNDVAKISIDIPTIHCDEDEWAYAVKINEALMELKHNGGGPVHINLETNFVRDFNVKTLPKTQVIDRIEYKDQFPELKSNRIGIFVGNHKKFDLKLTEAIDKFCAVYNGVVFCDHTSNYKGKYRIHASLVAVQTLYLSELKKMDTLIHIGDVSGSYVNMIPTQVWRVDPDGMVRDTFKKLRYVFEMEEYDFFNQYVVNIKSEERHTEFYDAWKKEAQKLTNKIPELPFSNAWIAKNTLSKIPSKSVLYLGILNTLRTWNFYESTSDVTIYSNTGGFGIDGGVSTLVGMSLSDQSKLYFGIIGDLGFFYDMNAIGNRHIGKNIRLLIVNNGRGTEFRNYDHPAARFGEDADAYMAAAGHYGNKSQMLLKHYAEDLGFKYISAKNKQEYLNNLDEFLDSQITDKSILFEVFTTSTDESDAVKIMYTLEASAKVKVKNMAKNVLGDNNIKKIKGVLGK